MDWPTPVTSAPGFSDAALRDLLTLLTALELPA
jgi:hypothetical protein